MLNIFFLACTKVELWDLTVCIVVNGEKFRNRAVTLTLVIVQKHTNTNMHTDACIHRLGQVLYSCVSEKPIVAVFILDFYIYILLSLWSHVLAWSSLTWKKADIVSCQEALAQIRNICMLQKFLTNCFQTTADCLRYIHNWCLLL